jgi:hypothetical protein
MTKKYQKSPAVVPVNERFLNNNWFYFIIYVGHEQLVPLSVQSQHIKKKSSKIFYKSPQ